MKKFLSFAKHALFFAGRAVAAGVLPAIATYYWTSSNHYNYWNRTIFAVQTIDFNILSHTLPTKLSTLIIQNDTEEIQRTLQSNTGRFGMVVTDCKTVDKECPDQKLLYRTKSRSSWSRNFSMEVLKDAPFDVLRDPPPLKSEISFPDIYSQKTKAIGSTNTGNIIGRIYYVRGIPPSYWQSWERWFQDPSLGVGSIYTPSVTTFFTSWFLLILTLEIVINKIKAKNKENQKLERDLNEAQEKNTVILKEKSKVLAKLRKAEDEQQELLAYLQQSVTDSETWKASLEAAKDSNSQLQVELQEKLNESAQNLTSYEQQLKSNTEYIDDLKKTIAFHQENLVPQAEIETYLHKLYEAKSNQDRLNQLIESQNQAIRLKKQELQSLNGEKIELETKLNDAAAELSTNQIRVSKLEDDLKQLEDSINELKADKDHADLKAQELQSLLLDTKNSEANLQWLLEQAKTEGESLVEMCEQELRKTKDFYVNYAEDLEQQKAQFKSKIQDLECDLISARSDRDYFGLKNPEIAEIPLVDISSLYIGFVGGESRTLNRVTNRLQKDHGLMNYVLLEEECDHNQNIFRAKLNKCNLIALITVKVGHPHSYILKNLQSRGAITENLLFINVKGESGIVREIVNYSQNLDMKDAA